MNSSTPIGPSAQIRSRNWSASEDISLSDAGRPQSRLDPDAPLLGGQHQIEAAEDHRHAQPLAHVQAGRLRELDQLRVRLADELDGEAEDSVEKDEGADELAGLVAGLRAPEHPGEDEEQDNAFQGRLVELARVPGRAERGQAGDDLREADCPRDVGRGAPQLVVHEIGEPAEEQAEGYAAGDIIMDPEPR